MLKLRKIFKRFYRLAIAILLLFFILFVVLYFAIQSPRFQTFISQKITTTLSAKFNTEIKIKRIKVEFFNNILIEDFLIEDLEEDTLIHFSSANAKFSYFSLLDKSFNLDEIKIKNLNLNMHRHINDTVFNFNFLLPKKNDNDKKDKEIWAISINDISLENTFFTFEDSLTGTLFYSKVPDLTVNMKEFNLDENRFDIKKVIIKNPSINLTKSKNYNKNEKKFVLDIPPFIYVQKIEIENAKFNFINNIDTTNYKKIAFNDIGLFDVNVNISNTYLWKDSLSTKIDYLTLKEKSGFGIKKMKTQFSLNNKKMSLDTFFVKTNNSIINTKADLKYRNFSDFKKFKDKIRFKANLTNTTIDPEDFKYFVETKGLGLGGVFKIEGEIKGKLSSLKAKNINLSAGNRTNFKGNFSLTGLPNIEQTFISFKMNRLVTDYDDLKFIHYKIPLPVNTRKLGTIIFKGRFDGFYSDFVTYGEAQTDLGFINTDINLKINKNGVPHYSGNFNIDEFNIGSWFNKEKIIGTVTLKGEIEGKGLKLNTLDVKLKGNVEKFIFKNYTYTNLDIDGSIKDKFFKGKATIEDEHIKFDFEGLVDATGDIPIFNFKSNLDYIDLLPLNLAKKDYRISAKLNSNFKANNIDDILGDLNLQNVKIEYQNKFYKLNNLQLHSRYHDHEKHLDIKADNFNVLIHGDYQITKLPLAVQYIFLENDTSQLRPQKLRFDVEITDKTDLISLFVPKLKIPNKITISGNLNTETQSILTMINIPKIKYGKIKTFDFISNIRVDNGKIDMINSLPKVVLNDSVLVKDISIIANGFKDNISFSVNAKNKSEKNQLGLNGKLTYFNELFTLKIDDNSTVLINNSFWNIAKNNSISFNKDKLSANNFKISSNKSEANFEINRINDLNNLVINLKNIEVADFAEILKEKGLDIKGLITGEVKIDNFDIEPAINGNLNFAKIFINQYNIGDFNLNSRVDIPDKKVYLSGGLFSRENHVDINGYYSFSKESKKDDINIDIFIKQFTVKSFEDFIPKFIHNSSGTVNGNLKLYGKRKSPNLNGFIDVNDVTTTVTYTQVKYTISETKVLLNDNILQLENGFILQDDEGNIAYGSGNIVHENFKDWRIDLKVETEKIKALNTTINDNETFNGIAYINGGARFTGLTTEPLIYIWGESEGESIIDIPLLDNVKNKQHEFYNFISKSKSKKSIIDEPKKDKAIKIRGAKVKLDLNLDEDLELKLILDQDAGDILKVKGNGIIKIDVGQAAEYVNFFGNYNISKGNYLFTMQNIVNKPFTIKPGSSINFNGDIYEDATIKMAATYDRRVALDNFIKEYLSSTEEELLSISRNRVPVTLFLDLTGRLSKPTIKFDIGIDRVDPKIRSYVESKLQAIKLSESEMNNQIFGVLVLSRFLPSYSAIENSIGNDAENTAINTVSELVTSQLSRYATDWVSNYVKGLDIMVNFSSYDQNAFSDITLRNRRELQLALTQRLFDDRLSINVGGNFDFGETYSNIDNSTSNATFFGANVNFEYSITKNRRWRIKAFAVSDFDNYNTENNRKTKYGFGLSYKREFDNVKELFNLKK